MPSIHEAAATGYQTAAATYAAGRPDYPAASETWLREVVGLKAGRVVLDLGAGTGKFLPYLRRTGARLLAVEPVAAMRGHIERENPDVTAIAGTATAIPLPDAAVDAVVCAQAFHWFATPEALTEIGRVLTPGGILGLIWNVRDESVPWVAALTDIVDVHEGDAPRYRSGAWRQVFPAEGFALQGERHIRHEHVGPAERVVVDRVMSISFVAALPPDDKAAVLSKVRALIAATPELAGRGDVALPYDTAMFAYRRTA